MFIFADHPTIDNPSLIVHPYDYTGTGGSYTVNVCLSATATQIASQVQQAIDFWNAYPVSVGNCSGRCSTYEDSPPPEDNYFIVWTIVHELGHCALGLHHPNRDIDSRTRTYQGTVNEPPNNPDNVPGSSDDVASPLPGARLIHWYRVGQNNPFFNDASPIDNSTFTRVFANLPAGHNWAANGNRRVGVLLNQPVFSHSMMYTLGGPDTTYIALIPDDVDTVLFGASGLDEEALTADDYSVDLQLVADCANADIQVRFSSIAGGNDRPLGICDEIQLTGIPIAGQSLRHYRLEPDGSPWPYSVITIDNAHNWDVSALPFSDGFETGDASFWSFITEP
ncbi:MAG: hypothetical protein K8H90_01525 [Thermoanaerobaculia bacterium]|nr:hypothetical protein [Thermoanaerobaculia bacterium]